MLVAAAGSGQRLGGVVPKQYQEIHGKRALRHTLEAILSWPGLKSLRVIIDPSHADMYHDTVSGLALEPPLHGGRERKDSINSALYYISDIGSEEIILVHDAARPCIAWPDVQRLLAAMNEPKTAASLALPVTDTLRRGADVVDRNGLWAVQTPQAFYFGDLKRAHALAKETPYTDDTGLVSAIGVPVHLVEGSKTNIKITTPEDMALAALYLSENTETRSGSGFDVHAFEDAPTNRKLILGGVEFAHERALAGHSDADVALHAITDALLGAIGAGDIGRHFPPSDQTYKDMDSAIFLQKAVEMVTDAGGRIINIDLTIICESPKIGPKAAAMRDRIAEIAALDASRINVKATTTEKLGFTGRGEGIAAQAIANVRMPC